MTKPYRMCQSYHNKTDSSSYSHHNDTALYLRCMYFKSTYHPHPHPRLLFFPHSPIIHRGNPPASSSPSLTPVINPALAAILLQGNNNMNNTFGGNYIYPFANYGNNGNHPSLWPDHVRKDYEEGMAEGQRAMDEAFNSMSDMGMGP